jgi:hypothetical protein
VTRSDTTSTGATVAGSHAAAGPVASSDGSAPPSGAPGPEEVQSDVARAPDGVDDDDLLDEPAEALPRLLKIVGAVVAPTTVLTGLLFYFGRLHVTGFFRYFRVNFTVLELTPNDYLVRSADGLFVPLTQAALVGLAGLWLNRFLAERLPPTSRRRALRILAPAALAVGVVLLGVALVELLGGRRLFPASPEAGGLCMAGGVLLLSYGAHLLRVAAPRRPGGRAQTGASVLAEWGCAFLLVTIGLFWAVGSYAIGVGTGRAMETQAGLPAAADAVLYSERSLRLAVAGVTEVRCEDPEAAYRFRYDGLKLVLQAGNQYLLVPVTWTRENGTAVLLPRGDGVRLEFAPPGQVRSATC